jgi:hypothetical protein
MDRDSPQPIAHLFGLAGVQAGPDCDPQPAQSLNERAGAANRPRRLLEGSEEAVAGGVDLTTPVLSKQPPDDRMVPLDELTPATVAQICCQLGRANDVRE